jgi:predicted ATPase with chaperone activity
MALVAANWHGEGEAEGNAGVVTPTVLLLGPPGSGTSRLARRLTTILPGLTLAEALDTTRLHRVAGLTGRRPAVVTTRPCRAPTTPFRTWG